MSVWDNETKSSNTWSNQIKNSASWTNGVKANLGSFLLMENGEYLLQENTGKIAIEGNSTLWINQVKN